MTQFNRQFQIALLLSICSILIAGESILKGKVRHANTYNEIPDVNIYIENSGIGTVSDFGGEFLLETAKIPGDALIVFKHVAFDSLKISLSEALKVSNFYLEPRIIQARNILVEAEKYQIGIMKDLPQPYSVIEAKRFDVQGYTDAGDLLRTEQNMQVEEELNGKKTVAIRGGNADDVIILYNGIKMNNNYDNVFDLSLINLEDIEHFEIIRGSNTAIYGPEAFSGVINIVPKTYRNYTVRFQQKFGTYASGDWSLLLNHNFFKKLNLSYSYKQGASKREYADSSLTGEYLQNSLFYHSANAVYDFNGGTKTNSEQNLSIMYFRTSQDYDNTRYEESLSNLNQLITMRYTGHIGVVHDLNLTGSYQWYDISQIIAAQRGFLDRQFKNRSLNLGIEKSKKIDRFQVLAAYQYESNELDYLDGRYDFDEFQLGLESALLKNHKHGFVSVIKFQSPTGSDFMDRADIDLSYRYDYVKNERGNEEYRGISRRDDEQFRSGLSPENIWSESMVKISTHLSGHNKFFIIDAYLNAGKNIKFPTLFQQMSTPLAVGPNSLANSPELSPEKNRTIEIGMKFLRETDDKSGLNGWEFSANYFKNYYENKFRMYYLPSIPVAFYDNVQNADISGLEGKWSLFIWKKKLTLEAGASRYFISEKAAFPFKHEQKYIANVFIDHAGYSFQVHWFHESEQLGWVRTIDGNMFEVMLEGYSNMDIHLSKSFEIKEFKLFANISGRNILNVNRELEGIALNDRRFYITLGVEY